LAGAALLATSSPSGVLAADRPSVTALHAPVHIRIDGALDEPEWAGAPVVTAFRLHKPREGEMPDESTAVRVIAEDRRLVFGIWCSTRRPLRASLTPRDQITDADHIAMHLDTDGEGQRAYIFGINPYGIQLDGILTLDPDFKWDAVWEGAAKRDSGAWTAEIAVPYRAMRFPAHATRPWRLWIRREITAWNEVASWPPWKSGEAGPIMLQAADLEGLEGVHGGRALTLEPYLFGSQLGVREQTTGALPPWSSSNHQEAGADLQAGVTSALTLNATYNPDFSQIEADALQINLNLRYPLQFPEKRPFFLEGVENFVTPLELLYTRRMADPHWGAKLNGRAGPLNTGALVVRDHGGASLDGTGFGFTDISRPGYFAVARASLPFGNGSNIGVFAGGHTQDAVEPVPGDPNYRSDGTLNHIVAADTQIRLSDRWTLESQFGNTVTRSDSVRADGATARESFSDWIGVVRLNYQDQARVFRFGTRYVGPEYRNELGYQERVGVVYRQANLDWSLYPRSGMFQRVTPVSDNLVIHDHTGRIDFADINPHLELQWRSNLYADAGFHEYVEHWLGVNYPQERMEVYFEDTRWRPLTWNIDALIGDGIYYGATSAESYLAWTETYNAAVTARPSPWLTAAGTFGHYRLAHDPGSAAVLNQWLLGVNINAQFTRELSVRFYPQYDSSIQHLDLNGLIAYVVHPGTVFYLGVNSGWDHVPDAAYTGLQTTARQLFAKASYRFEM
jgi:hypothetical protein